MTLIKPITLEIEDTLWDKFKKQIPRTIRLNDAIVNLIEQETKNGKQKT